ncbi:uncharacterized protein RCO7_05603 [Rhynchosporium graminicola]|uniref:Uncharacterized protein n=1 Tax=Rhynchosporium graminicola TaxID=2792576 RepID=A0A1E1L0B0_9HELO|nr:uncharacterized protein RCO7_05603 [Rhynchosporium commune]
MSLNNLQLPQQVEIPLPALTGLHVYVIFAVVILLAIWLEDLNSKGVVFSASKARPIRDPTIAIALGRSYSSVATFRDHVFETVIGEQGHSKIPSCVRFPQFGPPVLGFEAGDQLKYDESGTTVRDLGFLFGREWSDPELQPAIQNLPQDVMAKEAQVVMNAPLDATDTFFSVEGILAFHLTHLKNITEGYLNQTKAAVELAAISAGLDLKLLISDSKAISEAYHIDRMVRKRDIGKEGVADYFLIYQINNEGSRLSVEYSLRRDRHTVGFLDDGFDLWNCHLSSDFEWSSSTSIALVERLLKTSTLENFFVGRKILKDEEDSFRDDQAILYGAALVAYDLSDDFDHIFPCTIDTTIFDIGIQTQGEEFLKIFPEAITIPRMEFRVVTTTTNDHGNAVINVYEGRSLVASENRLLGSIELDELSVGPKVEVEVEIIFVLDAYGALIIEGTEKKSMVRKEAVLKVFTTLDW